MLDFDNNLSRLGISDPADDRGPDSDLRIVETIVVEGKDDLAALKAAVSCSCIITHGLGFGEEKLREIEEAAERTGIVIFTDPDYAGEKIRRRIRERVPSAKHAYLDRKSASKGGGIGVENASPQAIRRALKKAHVAFCQNREEFTPEDLMEAGLSAVAGSKERRIGLAKELGLSYGNSKKLLDQLNHYGISRREFDEAIEKINAGDK